MNKMNRHSETLGQSDAQSEPYEPCDSFKFYKVETLDWAKGTESEDYKSPATARNAYEAVAKLVPALYKYAALRNREGAIIDQKGEK